MQLRFFRHSSAAVVLLAAAPMVAAQVDEPHQKRLSVEFESPAVVIAGDATLTEADLQAHVENIPPKDRSGFVNSPRRIAETAEQQTRQEHLAQAALEAGLLEDPVRSARIYRSAVEKLASWQLEAVVERRKLEDYEQQARELYLAKPERFREPASFSFTHLLVGVADRSEEAAMRHILSMVDELAEGAAFDDLVAEHSDDPTANENQGRYEAVPPDRLDDNFARALRGLEPGELSEPVRSRFGWHLIRLDEVHPGRVPSWEEARDEAIELAEQRHEEQIRQDYIQEVAGDHQVDLVPDLVDRIQRRYGVPGDVAPGN